MISDQVAWDLADEETNASLERAGKRVPVEGNKPCEEGGECGCHSPEFCERCR